MSVKKVKTVKKPSNVNVEKEYQSPPLSPKTENQSRYMDLIRDYPLVFGLGPAGTGKTYVAAGMAAEMLESGEVASIIVTRPAVEAGESIGFLPGYMDEKFEPYFAPVKNVFDERLGVKKTALLVKMGVIKPVPLNFMRGWTLKDCFVLFDEAQNSTRTEMKMFLTRLGENCKAVVDGDIEQSDIEDRNGLEDALAKLRGLNSVATIEFTEDDIVRSKLAKDIILRYRKKSA